MIIPPPYDPSEPHAITVYRIRLRQARIPKAYELATVSGYKAEDDPQRALRSAVANWITTGERGLFISGNTGCGKTHLAIAALRSRIRDRGVNGLFVDWATAAGQMARAWHDRDEDIEGEILGDLIDAPVLVLDDLGGERHNEANVDRLHVIINERCANGGISIITSNLSLDAVGDRYGSRIKSRIIGACDLIEAKGVNDWRRNHATQTTHR